MNARFGLVCVAAAVALALFAGAADAQIVTLGKETFTAEPAKVQPQGVWSVAPKSGAWRIEFDYGTINNGAFTRDATLGVGGTFELPVAGGDGKWKAAAVETLKQPLAKDGVVRARLQKKDAQGKWVDQGDPAYLQSTSQPQKTGS